MKNLVVLSGAGVSADSGLNTFRDSNGLWEGHDVMQVASPQGFHANPELVLEFYNQRRRQLSEVEPNAAHLALAELEAYFKVEIITQNVDDLHERAGSSRVMHLHGELLKARSTGNPNCIRDWNEDILLGQTCPEGYQWRPHIVWFGEEVPLLQQAAQLTATADLLLIIGTSLQVYPAASLVHYAPESSPIFLVDPKPAIRSGELPNLEIVAERASEGVPRLAEKLKEVYAG